MKRTAAGLFGAVTMLALQLHTTPADACGVKLIAKTPTPRQAVSRSSHPSDVLVVGTASGRLTRQLAAKGHKVEVASDPATAKRTAYAAVLTDDQHASAARAKFGDDRVLVVTNDLATDLKSVENQVARRPIRSADDRTVIAARTERKPVAAGPNAPDRRVAAAGQQQPTEAAAAPAATPAATPPAATPPAATPPAAVATTAPTRTETPPSPPKKEKAIEREPARTEAPAERKPATVAVAPTTQELHFGLGSSAVNNNAAITRAAKWLRANPDLTATIAGHADPTGTPEGNMALSQTRAEKVRDLLVNAGIAADRLEVQAFGDTQLKYDTRDGRNRRVVIAPKQ